MTDIKKLFDVEEIVKVQYYIKLTVAYWWGDCYLGSKGTGCVFIEFKFMKCCAFKKINVVIFMSKC
jgi:hypothetical protein